MSTERYVRQILYFIQTAAEPRCLRHSIMITFLAETAVVTQSK